MWPLLALLCLAARAHALSRVLLYEHGTGADAQLPRGNAVSSPEIFLKVPVAFYGETYSSLYVNNHGLVSFRTDIPTFFNAEFPLAYPSIAALYCNVDTTASGVVFYRESQQESDLRKADVEISDNFPGFTNFRARSVFLATWIDVGYHPASADKVNTFQLAIISNGTESFVQLLYPDNGVQWIQGLPQQSGLPDARAQAGFVAEDGRFFELRGSGTHQIRNIVSWTNTQVPGKYIFRVGNLLPNENIAVPEMYDKSDDDSNEEYKTCPQTGSSVCHMNARCVDYQSGICCQCNDGFYGNGKTCVKIDVPLRVNGKLTGELNSISLGDIDIQSYVVVVDGRTYTAISQAPESIGYSMQSLDIFGGVIGWLFAKPLGSALNGYQLTGAVFNHTAEISFPTTGDRVTIRQQFLGHDVFDQVTLEADVRGTVPALVAGTQLEIAPYEEQYTTTDVGVIRSDSRRIFRDKNNALEYEARISQTFRFSPCRHAPVSEAERVPVTLKVAKNFLGYQGNEDRQGVVRYGMSNKIVPLGQEDPCIRGRQVCTRHSSCIVDGDSFRCVCEAGYRSYAQNNGEEVCVDLDECATGNNNCDVNAQCHNYEGSFQCACKGGFEGDGIACVRIPLCRNYQCNANAYCHETISGPECTCNDGFEGDGRRCWIPEQRPTATPRPGWSSISSPVRPSPSPRPVWSSSPPPQQPKDCRTQQDCSSYATCELTASGYVCVCINDYYGDGHACYPQVETPTSAPETVPIDYDIVAASCLFNFCTCGFSWDKFTDANGNPMCRKQRPENELIPTTTEDESTMTCATSDECPQYSECQYNPHTQKKECRCLEGYAVDGDGECAEERHTGGSGTTSCGQCDPHAACVYLVDGSSACVCDSGYTGDGLYCRPGSDCRNDTDCEANAACAYNSYTGSPECQCRQGYTKDNNGACVPSESCNGALCAEHASCLFDQDNSIYYCQCDQGYEGEAIEQCVKIRPTCEVARDCHPDALCVRDDFTLRYSCICREGFTGNGYICDRVLPPRTCLTDPSMCSHHASCVRRLENLTCECRSGFRGDGFTCEPGPRQQGGFLLLATGTYLLRVPFKPSAQDPIKPVLKSNWAVGLDVDCQTGQVYWGDVNSRVINSAYYDGSYSQVFTARDVNSAEGVSVDWVSRNIYWTDSTRKTIEVANLDTKIRATLINTGLFNPRGIAVHPQRGKIFWSDWNRKAPKIEWANMDGSERGVFISGPGVRLPNSLAIDWRSDKLCYADAGLHTIECIQIDSMQRNTFASNCSYPFGLAITEDTGYWTDWKTNKIESVDGRSNLRDNIRVSTFGSKMYGMAVANERCVQMSNLCQQDNGGCPAGHLCLLTGQRGRTCLCGANEEGLSLC